MGSFSRVSEVVFIQGRNLLESEERMRDRKRERERERDAERRKVWSV
jgi:hypothetical protein